MFFFTLCRGCLSGFLLSLLFSPFMIISLLSLTFLFFVLCPSLCLCLSLFFHLCSSLFPLKIGSQVLAQWLDERIHNAGYFKCISKSLTSEQTMKPEFFLCFVLWHVFLFLTWSVTTGRWSGREFGAWEQFNTSPSSSLDIRPQNKVKDPCSTCWSLSRSV